MSDHGPTGGRRPYRPPVGIPEGKQRRWRGLIASIAIHAGLLALLLIPPIAALVVVDPRTAGILGLRRGGGGGRGPTERLHFMEAAPAPPAATKPKPPPPVPPPVPPPRVPPRVPPPQAPPPTPAAAPSADTSHAAPASGTSGPGSGPGTGGGIGAGTGPGVGNGKGPGTGGDGATKIKATTKLVTAGSVDPPKHPRPFHLVAVFEVQANGNSRLLSVNKADDGDFNKKMREHLLETEFYPATLANGKPVADTVVVTADY